MKNTIKIDANILAIFKNKITLPDSIQIDRLSSELELSTCDCYFTFINDHLHLVTDKFQHFNCYQYYVDVIEDRILTAGILQSIIKKNTGTALDLFAGFGRDSFIFLHNNYQVTAVENNPYIFTMLSYFNELYYKNFAKKLNLIYGDAYDLIVNNNLSSKFTLIYIDPMFNDGGSALPPKDMQIIAYLDSEFTKNNINADADVKKEAIFNLQNLRQYCSGHIIVKRDNKQKFLFEKIKPAFQKKSRCVRFDVY